LAKCQIYEQKNSSILAQSLGKCLGFEQEHFDKRLKIRLLRLVRYQKIKEKKFNKVWG